MSAKQVAMSCRWWLCLIGLALAAVEAAAAETMPATPPIDPFDYSYCGGEPVYPVVGYNFATSCGPRNQIALGRRGALMWSFPSQDNLTMLHRGKRQLTPEELKRLSLLAEVAQFSEPSPRRVGPVVYTVGIDFAGRPYRRLRAVLTDDYTPANELFRALLSLVPDQPLLPDCPDAAPDFDPTQLPAERRAQKGMLSEKNHASH